MSLESAGKASTDIGVVDWNDLTNNREKFNSDIIKAFQENGLLFIKNSPLLKVREEMEQAAEAFFSNSDKLKEALSIKGNVNEGYHIPEKGDYKEYFHFGGKNPFSFIERL